MDNDNGGPEPRKTPALARRGAKASRPNGAGSQKGYGDSERMRVTYRIPVETWQRIGIHCRLARVDEAAFVNRAALKLLREIGKGQDVFDRPDTQEDRQDTTAA